MFGAIPFAGNLDGRFSNGNAPAGLRGTLLDAAWFNAIQDELLGLLSQAGIAADPAQPFQVSQAVLAIIGLRADQLVAYQFPFVAPAGGTLPGQAILVGDIFGVVAVPASAGLTSTMFVMGNRACPKLPGEAWTQQGAALYWDDVAKVLKLTPATGYHLVGSVAQTATAGATSGVARLNGAASAPLP